MRGRRQRRLVEDALDGGVRALARRAAGAIGHRDEIGRERRQARDRPPTACFSISSVFGGKNSNETRMRRAPCACRAGWRAERVHHATSRDGRRAAMRGSRASQSETRDLACAGSGASVSCVTTSRPAASSHCVDRLGREAEPAMRMLLAQEFEIMRREIDDEQPPARRAARARPRASRARRRRGNAAPDG